MQTLTTGSSYFLMSQTFQNFPCYPDRADSTA
jgi:hypothetical protein